MAAIANTDTTKASRSAREASLSRADALRKQLYELEAAQEKLTDTIIDVRMTLYAEEAILRQLPATQGPNGSMARELEEQRERPSIGANGES
jgi:hypothetical protein